MYSDLSEEEEAQLPLPPNWVRTVTASIGNIVYKNLKTGAESDEHPFVLQAMNAARKLPLPVGWSVQEARLSDGSIDYFYCNKTLAYSNWDPPHLRHCLADCLGSNGFSASAYDILSGAPIWDDTENDESFDKDDEVGNYDQDHFNEVVSHNAQNIEDDEEDESIVQTEEEATTASEIPPPPLMEDSSLFLEGFVSGRARSEQWQLVRESHKQTLPENAPKTKKIEFLKPPMTLSGIRVLTSDVCDADERVRELVSNVRVRLAKRMGVESRSLDRRTLETQLEQSERTDSDVPLIRTLIHLLSLASDVVTALLRHPEYIISTMTSTDPQSLDMVYVGFTVLHRLLHPFTSDQSLTTALLLEGINYQMEEAAHAGVVEGSDPQSTKQLLGRALLISDPATAYNWNALGQPLPLTPNVPSETVLMSLLKMYALRREVAAFFRAVWKPVFPAVMAVVVSDEIDGTATFSNLFAVATRIISCVLNPKVMAAFPAPATAVCRSLSEISGNETTLHYIFNLLLLPNLLKIIAVGDHESIENERTYQASQKLEEFFDRQYDLNGWWPEEGFALSLFDPCNSLVWMTWRLFSAAALIDEVTLSTLHTPDFFRGGPLLDMTGVSDAKLRNCLARMRRSMESSLRCLLRMPLDTCGSKYLNVDPTVELAVFQSRPDLYAALQRRLISLLIKPAEMASTVVVSQSELMQLFGLVRSAVELSGHGVTSPLYVRICEFMALSEAVSTDDADFLLHVYVDLPAPIATGAPPLPRAADGGMGQPALADGDVGEEGMGSMDGSGGNGRGGMVRFHDDVVTRGGGDDGHDADGVSMSTAYRYQQLCHGLVLANKFEETLLRILQKIDSRQKTSLYDLVEEESLYRKSELDVDLHTSDDVDKFGKHTEASKKKIGQSNYGLEKIVKPKLAPSKRPASWEHVSLKTMESEFLASFRFGSPSANVNVGTSMGRHTGCFAPHSRPTPRVAGGNNVGGSLTMGSNRSKYTKFDVKPDSNFLVVTESVRHYKVPQRPTWRDKEMAYMQSLRQNDIIPTKEFLQRKRRSRSSGGAPSVHTGSLHTPGGSNTAGSLGLAAANLVASAAKPFPEHLRHRVRHDDYETGSAGMSSSRFGGSRSRTGPGTDGHGGGHGSGHEGGGGRRNGGGRSERSHLDQGRDAEETGYDDDDDYDELTNSPDMRSASDMRRRFSPRGDSGDVGGRGGDRLDTGTESFRDPPSPRGDGEYEFEEEEEEENQSDEIASIIRDYRYVFAPVGKRPTPPQRQWKIRRGGQEQEEEELGGEPHDNSRNFRGSGPSTTAPQQGRGRGRGRGPSGGQGGNYTEGNGDEYNEGVQSRFDTARVRNDVHGIPSSEDRRGEGGRGSVLQSRGKPYNDYNSGYDNSRRQHEGGYIDDGEEELEASMDRAGDRNYRRRDGSPTPLASRIKSGSRPLSPKLPEPIPGTNFFAPTQSLLRKLRLAEEKSFKNKFFSDLEAGILPGLREHEPRTYQQSPPPTGAAVGGEGEGGGAAMSSLPAWRPTGQTVVTPPTGRRHMQRSFADAGYANNYEGDASSRGFPRPAAARSKSPSLTRTSREVQPLVTPVEEVQQEQQQQPQKVRDFPTSTMPGDRLESRSSAKTIEGWDEVKPSPPSPNPPPNTSILLSSVSAASAPSTRRLVIGDLSPSSPLPSVATVESQSAASVSSNNFSTHSPDSIKGMESHKPIQECNDHEPALSNPGRPDNSSTRIPNETDTIYSQGDSEESSSGSSCTASSVHGASAYDSELEPQAALPTVVPVILEKKKHNWNKAELKSILLNGVIVTKHGRSGSSKEKFLNFDEQTVALVWGPTKRSMFNFSGKQAQGSLCLADISEVRRGIQTEVMRKVKLVDPGSSFSIITPERSLDVTFESSNDRDMFLRGLQGLLEGKQSVRYI